MRLVLKLISVAALLTLGLVALSGVAQADINVVKVDSTTIASGDTVAASDGDTLSLNVTFNSAKPADVEFTASSVAAGSDIAFTLVTCVDDSPPTGDDCADSSGDGTNDLVIDDPTENSQANGISSITLSVDVNCDADDTMTVHIDETDGTATASSDSFDFDIQCDSSGTSGAITAVVITPPATLNCNAVTGVVEVLVSDSGGDPISGAAVTLTASAGTIFQTMPVNTAANGKVLINYAAPNAAGTVNFNASAKLGTDAAVTATQKATTIAGAACTSAAPTTAAPVATTATGGTLNAPRTGDGGLAGNGTSWVLYAALAVIGSMAGVLAVRKVRS